MLSSKSKSGLPEASPNKGSPATPRPGKLSRTGSAKADRPPSPLQSARLSIDRSLKSFDSKHSIEHRPAKISSDERQLRKGLEPQQLSAVQDELKKVKDRLAFIEAEKSQILEELKAAKNSADEANDKLQDALVSRRIAEEASEIDKFRADELEQAGIEVARQREEEWQKQVEVVRDQHAADVAGLLATTQELQRVQRELAMVTEAKNSALSHADDAMKIAEINADKVELLSREVSRLKGLLDSALESKNKEASEIAQKHMELQSQLSLVQENLMNANEHLASAEIEKIHIVEELNETKRLADEATEELCENLAARARAEESLEAIKIRTSELEKERIRNAQEREEKWQKKLESAEHQQALKAAALLSATEELEKAKRELELAIDAKNTALKQACDAIDNAESSAQKIELLSQEVSRHEGVLNSKMELESQVSALKNELEEAKEVGKRLAEVETLAKELRNEVNNANKAESDASRTMAEWKRNAELLTVQLEEAIQSQKSSSQNAASVIKQLQESNAVLHDKEFEVAALKDKVEILELEVVRHKTELDKLSQQLDLAREEAAAMQKTIQGLKSEQEAMEQAKLLATENENAATSKIKVLTQERNRLENELDVVRCELEKSRMEMEGLTLQLHEASTKAREAKEMLLTKQSEVEDSQADIEALKMIAKNNAESYEAELEKARGEIVCLQDTVERLDKEFEKSRSEWDSKALDFMNAIQRLEQEIIAIKIDMDRITDAMRDAEHQVKTAKEDKLKILDKIKHFDSETNAAYNEAEQAKAGSLQFKEMLLERENELQNVSEENADIRIQESVATEKAKELSSLLSEATNSTSEENDQALRNLKQKTPDENRVAADKPQLAAEPENSDECGADKEEKNAQESEQPETRDETNENDKTRDEDQETQSAFDESDSKIVGESLDGATESTPECTGYGASSPSNPQQQHKKKKAFMQKFGSLLKKKSNGK